MDRAAGARRAAYIYVKRSLLVPELELLDLADTNSSCEQRVVSTIPTQALTLLNGEFFNEQAQAMADRVMATAGSSPEARVDTGYRWALARAPTPEERDDTVSFLARQQAELAAESGAG